MKRPLWEYVEWMLHEDSREILSEPDNAENEADQCEQSVVANVAGVTLPLGASTRRSPKKVKIRSRKIKFDY